MELVVVVVNTGASEIYNYCDRIKDKRLFFVIEYNLLKKKKILFHRIRLAVPLLAVISKQMFFFLILSLNGRLSNCSYWKHWAAPELHSVSLYQGGELLYVNQQGDMDCLERSRRRVLRGTPECTVILRS